MDMNIVKHLMNQERGLNLMFKPTGYSIVDSGMGLFQEGDEIWRDITLQNSANECEEYSFSFSSKGALNVYQDTPDHNVNDLKAFLLDV